MRDGFPRTPSALGDQLVGIVAHSLAFLDTLSIFPLRCQIPNLGNFLRKCVGFFVGGGTNRSDAGLNLSGSWQQGHSATYNTPSRI